MRGERGTKKTAIGLSQENANLTQQINLIQLQNSNSAQDQSSQNPATVAKGTINQLGTPGIKSKGKLITLSKPVKVKGKLRLERGSETGTKDNRTIRKLSLAKNKHIPKGPNSNPEPDH